MTKGLAICRLARFSLTTNHANELAAFYGNAFGCRRLATERLSGPDFEKPMGVRGGALRVTLSLGEEIIELLQFDQPGRSYPANESVTNPDFQHFAIVVGNMGQAYQRLLAIGGWTPISRAGPQRLPESSGGVTAFKFRDPDGHPLELLAFPERKIPPRWQERPGAVCLGIDHSAIGVRDAARSIAFYQTMGFAVSARSLNQGPEQERLDDVAGVRVEVVSLVPREPSPHLELLCYRAASQNGSTVRSNTDVAATRLILRVRRAAVPQGTVDPDGHFLLTEGSAS